MDKRIWFRLDTTFEMLIALDSLRNAILENINLMLHKDLHADTDLSGDVAYLISTPSTEKQTMSAEILRDILWEHLDQMGRMSHGKRISERRDEVESGN